MTTLADDLEVIDRTIDELETRRVVLISKLVSVQTVAAGQKVIAFPACSVTVQNSGSGRHIW
jgi:hypothetical protein